jgi:hypothetical protein
MGVRSQCSICTDPLDYFARREIAFICNKDGEEVHLRYRSFDNQRELETAVRATCPDKIDVGAVFNAKVGPSVRTYAPFVSHANTNTVRWWPSNARSCSTLI